uniref:Uncharacterized protein n=1 Tax=Caenorhabditis japonica TaxID=281687 RepID=A0A8R1IAG1_CAEJA
MDSNSIGSSADFKNAKKITTRFKIWPTHFLDNIRACRQIAQLGGVRHWTITAGFFKGKNDIEHVFIFSLHPPVRYQNSINADMRVTVVNQISPEKSVIKTSSIDGMSGNNPFTDVAGLSHSTVVRKGSGFLDAKGRMILGFEIRVNYVLYKNFLMRWNFYDKLSTDFFVFEFEKSGKVKKLYAKTWLLRFHSPVIARMLDSGVNKLRIVGKEGYKDYDKFLQIVHGVDLALNDCKYQQCACNNAASCNCSAGKYCEQYCCSTASE